MFFILHQITTIVYLLCACVHSEADEQIRHHNLICNVVHFPHTKTKVSTRLYEIYDGIRSPYSSNFLNFLLVRLLSHSCSYEDRDETHEYVACRQILG